MCCAVLIGRDSNLWFGLTDFFIDDEEAVKSMVEWQQGKGGGRVLARVTCAPSLGISFFCFHNLHRQMIFPRESRPRELSSAEDFFPRKNESLFPFFTSKAKQCS